MRGYIVLGEYISQLHISAARYITKSPICDLAVEEERWTRSLDDILSREQEGMWFKNEGRGVD